MKKPVQLPDDAKWTDPPFLEGMTPEARAAYEAETDALCEQWELEDQSDLLPDPAAESLPQAENLPLETPAP